MRASALAAALLLSGCATLSVDDYARERSFRGDELPPARLDVQASEVSVTGFVSPLKDGAALRDEVAAALSNAVRSPPGAPPGRFRVRAAVAMEKSYFVMVPCLVVGLYFGCPFGQGVATVDLDYQAGEKLVSARGQASVWHGLYYNADVTRAALARALADAIAKVARQ